MRVKSPVSKTEFFATTLVVVIGIAIVFAMVSGLVNAAASWLFKWIVADASSIPATLMGSFATPVLFLLLAIAGAAIFTHYAFKHMDKTAK